MPWPPNSEETSHPCDFQSFPRKNETSYSTMIIPTNHESCCSRNVCHDKRNGIFSPQHCATLMCYLLKKGSVLKKTEKENRQIDRQAHRDMDKCSGSIIGTRAEERRKKLYKKTENCAQGFPAFQPVSL